ncbi:uncharacterized protein Pyn_19401 [Prunus yedoensis var. nudiflora]|uniref:Uncharacterized protein n=1 Tax=Prunus yedoensis var. nudiflora TaxID=2094558 RepID=A0A314YX65_PRUYE|nr:uncharacterized protein Pyn_19401 [Prunus yedoensis var. nudiflora]
MKFFLEFVSCCGIARPATTGEQAPLSDETSSLVPRRMRRRRKRGRPGNSGSTSPNSVEWRPSLSSISEDNVVAMVVERTAEVERAVKKREERPESDDSSGPQPRRGLRASVTYNGDSGVLSDAVYVLMGLN